MATKQDMMQAILADVKKVNEIKEKRKLFKRDLGLLKYGSYDWFWKPMFLTKKIKKFEISISTQDGSPVLQTRF